MKKLRESGPGIRLDIMTPSDVSFHDVERGKVDLIINRFDTLPQSFHQLPLWRDQFCCLVASDNPVLKNWCLDGYLASRHVWVSKTGMGVGVGMTPDDVQRLGFVDEALHAIDAKRNISVFTRHYQAAILLAQRKDLIVTIPSMAALNLANNHAIRVLRPPFEIPEMELKMVWSPLLQHDPGHKWIRGLIREVCEGIVESRKPAVK